MGKSHWQHHHAHPHKNDSIHRPVYLLHHPKGNLICKNSAPSPLCAHIPVFKKVYHPHGIRLMKAVFMVPALTHMITPDLQTQSHHLCMNIFAKLDTLSSTFISTFFNGPFTVTYFKHHSLLFFPSCLSFFSF